MHFLTRLLRKPRNAHPVLDHIARWEADGLEGDPEFATIKDEVEAQESGGCAERDR